MDTLEENNTSVDHSSMVRNSPRVSITPRFVERTSSQSCNSVFKSSWPIRRISLPVCINRTDKEGAPGRAGACNINEKLPVFRTLASRAWTNEKVPEEPVCDEEPSAPSLPFPSVPDRTANASRVQSFSWRDQGAKFRACPHPVGS